MAPLSLFANVKADVLDADPTYLPHPQKRDTVFRVIADQSLEQSGDSAGLGAVL